MRKKIIFTFLAEWLLPMRPQKRLASGKCYTNWQAFGKGYGCSAKAISFWQTRWKVTRIRQVKSLPNGLLHGLAFPFNAMLPWTPLFSTVPYTDVLLLKTRNSRLALHTLVLVGDYWVENLADFYSNRHTAAAHSPFFIGSIVFFLSGCILAFATKLDNQRTLKSTTLWITDFCWVAHPFNMNIVFTLRSAQTRNYNFLAKDFVFAMRRDMYPKRKSSLVEKSSSNILFQGCSFYGTSNVL